MKSFFEKQKFGSFISNEMDISSGKSVDHPCFVTKKPWKTCQHVTKEQVKLACASAKKASIELKNLTAYEKSALLIKTADLLRANKAYLAEIITREMGKPITESFGEVEYTASYFNWYAGEVVRIFGLEIPSRTKKKKIRVSFEPIGPCYFVTPWNFPLCMAGRKVSAALAASCPSINKPCTEAPITKLALAYIIKKAGWPSGSFNVLIGDHDVINSILLPSRDIKKVSFTGSVAIGKYLYKESIETLKKVTLELGGNAPFIVFEDANQIKAADELILSKFRNSGQSCVCANRILVHKNILDDFLEKVVARAKMLNVGNPFEEETQISTHRHPNSDKKAIAIIEDAIKKGAKRHLNSKAPYEPEVLTNVTKDMLAFQEESFSPIVPIMTFATIDEAITLANHTNYGLAAYVFTESIKTASYATENLEFGMIGLNDGLPSAAELPFGGIKDSGFGREGGPSGIYEFLYTKSISMKL
ncbi:succinate-semialdehyde dehydrogenase (NADP(+)) [Candidatus Aerophobetes bacterium]|uniref:Succinate-semialdehyde dehydrogenase (NADP(+)) n=1 Tax=Aerophobetes bacterium TaxID=2030807 RepID=A0A2A4YE36_UNCAE|nr:MAG: succinate-semialdehyde dehydrogenase (NADP(+)) [Candidatus Aerophobetes bacterium]